MKRKVKLFLLSLFLVLVLLGGCASQAKSNAMKAEYQKKILALETELQEKQVIHRQESALYTAQIDALQAKLNALSTQQNKDETTAEEKVEFRYLETESGLTITGYIGNAAMLHIPSHLNGKPVTAIGEHAFEGADLTAVILPEGITSIGWFAFYRCENLINVTLPASLSSIGYAVFDGCGKLTIFCPRDSYAERYASSYGFPTVIK